MFQDIRKKGSSLLIALMFAAIIVTFVISFGPQEQGCNSQQSRQNTAATVNGEVITAAEFRFAYENYYQYYQRMFRDFNNEMAKQVKISDRVLDGLIGDILVAQQAEKLCFKVSDEEVKKEIVENPYFLKNGKFDKEAYENTVKFTFDTTVPAYEERVRMQLRSKKLGNFILGNIMISDTEVKDEFDAMYGKIEAFVYVLSDDSLKAEKKSELLAKISDEEANSFLKDNENKAKMAFEDNVSKYAKADGNGQTVFEDVKLDVAKDLILKAQLADKIKADAEALLAKLKENPEIGEADLASQFTDWEIAKKEISVSKKSTFVKGVGFSPKFVAKLFADPKEGILSDVFVTEEDRHVVASITKHSAADMAEFESAKDQIESTLLRAKKSLVYENYVEKLRASAAITLNEDFLKLFTGSDSEK